MFFGKEVFSVKQKKNLSYGYRMTIVPLVCMQAYKVLLSFGNRAS